jgi:hypothetical protein
MARRKTQPSDGEQFLFSLDEMLGNQVQSSSLEMPRAADIMQMSCNQVQSSSLEMPRAADIIQMSCNAQSQPSDASVDIQTEPALSSANGKEEPFNKDRLVDAMKNAIAEIYAMDMKDIRLIAMESAVIVNSGISPNHIYHLRALDEQPMDGYKLLAIYYSSFAVAFPSMVDKLNAEYMEAYNEAVNS